MNKILSLIFLLLLAVTASGCSVLMAAVGEQEPDMKYLEPGTTQEEVESQFGAPEESVKQNDQMVNTYEYEMGDPPDSRRAMAHLFLNLYTFMLYELYATPLELFHFLGEDYKVDVTYDSSGKVVSSSKPIAD